LIRKKPNSVLQKRLTVNLSDPQQKDRKKLLLPVLRIIAGLVFVASGILKLLSIDVFELYIFGMGRFGFNTSAILARLIISGELLLGYLLLTGIYFKRTNTIAIVVILVFSGFLLLRIFSDHNDENCNCFGELIKMNPTESLIKNVLLLILFLVLRKHEGLHMRFQQSVFIFLCAFAIALPAILSPPDFLMRWDTPQQEFANTSEKLTINKQLQTLNIAEGKKIVCFFSVTCPYCELASKKISVIAEKNELQNAIIYIFAGNKEDLPEFWKRGGSKEYLYDFIPVRQFFDIAGPVVPSVFLTDNGIIRQQYNYRNIDEKEIKDFFGSGD